MYSTLRQTTTYVLLLCGIAACETISTYAGEQCTTLQFRCSGIAANSCCRVAFTEGTGTYFTSFGSARFASSGPVTLKAYSESTQGLACGVLQAKGNPGICVSDTNADDVFTGAKWGASPTKRESEEDCLEAVEPDIFVVNGKEENRNDHTEESWNAIRAKFFAQNRHRMVKAGQKKRESEEDSLGAVEPDIFVVDGKEENRNDHTEESWNAIRAKFFAQNRHRMVKAGQKKTKTEATDI